MRRVKPFQFMIGTRGILDRRALIENARTAQSIGYDGWFDDAGLADFAPVVEQLAGT